MTDNAFESTVKNLFGDLSTLSTRFDLDKEFKQLRITAEADGTYGVYHPKVGKIITLAKEDVRITGTEEIVDGLVISAWKFDEQPDDQAFVFSQSREISAYCFCTLIMVVAGIYFMEQEDNGQRRTNLNGPQENAERVV